MYLAQRCAMAISPDFTAHDLRKLSGTLQLPATCEPGVNRRVHSRCRTQVASTRGHSSVTLAVLDPPG